MLKFPLTKSTLISRDKKVLCDISERIVPLSKCLLTKKGGKIVKKKKKGRKNNKGEKKETSGREYLKDKNM